MFFKNPNLFVFKQNSRQLMTYQQETLSSFCQPKREREREDCVCDIKQKVSKSQQVFLIFEWKKQLLDYRVAQRGQFLNTAPPVKESCHFWQVTEHTHLYSLGIISAAFEKVMRSSS